MLFAQKKTMILQALVVIMGMMLHVVAETVLTDDQLLRGPSRMLQETDDEGDGVLSFVNCIGFTPVWGFHLTILVGTHACSCYIRA